MSLICPECGGDNVNLRQDTIIHYYINDVKPLTGREKEEVTGLDNMWLECDDCLASTDSDVHYSEKLNRMLKVVTNG